MYTTMSSSVIGAYDFLNAENNTKWSGWLQPGLRKVCSAVLTWWIDRARSHI